jgi:hypothetical protein
LAGNNPASCREKNTPTPKLDMTGVSMKKVALMCTLILLWGYGSYAADDPLKRGMQLYKKNHYADAANLIQPYLSQAASQHQGKTYAWV